MSTIDPTVAQLTAPGTPFAIGEQDGMRRFVNAPASLDMLIESGRRHGAATFVVEGDARLSFDDVFARRDALAAALPVTPGEHVVICMRNRAAWMVAFLAVMRAGGVAVLVNSRGAPAELRAAVEDFAPPLVLADRERAELLRQSGYDGDILEAKDFPLEGGADFVPPARGRDDPATVLFTSGTTGRVKGAVLTHGNMVTALMGVQLSGLMVLHDVARKMGVAPEALMVGRPQAAVLLVYPLFHISGLVANFLTPLLTGGKVVIMRRWDAEEALRLIEAERISMFSGVPTMLWDVLHRARLADADLSSLTNIASGGQALPINLLDAIRERCPNAAMGTGYGMTETSGTVAMAVGEDFIRRRAATGRVLDLYEVRIEGPDGAALPPGEAGEIVVRGPTVMQGYWNRPEETAAVLGPDGWLRTGDIGYVDDENYLFIVDRKKDMVISGGENIYCAEVERVLSLIPELVECAAFGLPDERLGERLVAVVVGEGLDEDKVRHHVGEHLARYKAPVRVGISTVTLPRNGLGKVDKAQLRSLWPQLAGDR
ncbi:long-chain fatty acid--CoA ligase [Sphingomonas sp. CL5.1]|uniref:class I adenylate-forming enzyme family protein n=1 Tax=Sphingomonas sp. CL5.1 TaxID=2653203 RepID=UPI001583DA9B|nr:AMP-binding protein [Sphingomonas sp. CL5.1]QKS01429.1 long-chain fatty acid--CoA ligase [Sphingomonas sp. CL5.1]